MLVSATGSAEPPPSKVLAIIVPGTWGNDGFWTNEVDERATFTSELKRAMGPAARTYAFLWDGANSQQSREIAAESLASLIDKKGAEFDRICIVGHSHGGNIALRAAALSHTKIDMVVCLSTPHAYLRMKSDNGTLLAVPIYCSRETRAGTKTIVSIVPDSDDVPGFWADVDLGISNADAIRLTQSWGELLGFPRLREDSALTHFAARTEVTTKGQLKTADANIEIRSLVPPILWNVHSTIHSRRMGYVVGELLRDGLTKNRLEYVQTILQPKDADDGNPISLREEESFDQLHRQDYQQLGWRLDSIDVELTQTATRIARNLDGSAISPYVQMTMQSQPRSSPGLKTEPVLKSLSASWKPNWVIQSGQVAQLKVCAFHALQSDVELPGTLTVAAGSDAPANTASGIGWSAKLQWSRVHY